MAETFNYDDMLAAQGYTEPAEPVDQAESATSSAEPSTLEKTTDWIKSNPYTSAGIAAAALYLATRGR